MPNKQSFYSHPFNHLMWQCKKPCHPSYTPSSCRASNEAIGQALPMCHTPILTTMPLSMETLSTNLALIMVLGKAPPPSHKKKTKTTFQGRGLVQQEMLSRRGHREGLCLSLLCPHWGLREICCTQRFTVQSEYPLRPMLWSEKSGELDTIEWLTLG